MASFSWSSLFLVSWLTVLVGVDAGATIYTQPITLPKLRTLVLLEKLEDKAANLAYFTWLESILDVKYETPDKAVIKKYGEYLFDNLFVFASGLQDTKIDILDFIDGGNNVVVVAKPLASLTAEPESALSDHLRTVATDCGIYFGQNNVVDHFENDGSPDRIVTSEFTRSYPVLPKGGKPVVYRGLGMDLEEGNPLLIPILTAKSTSFVLGPGDNNEDLCGKNIALVAGLQARVGSRAVFVGSTELFAENKWGNLEFIKDVTKWVVQQRGMLRYTELRHHKDLKNAVGDKNPPYSIRNDLHFEIKIEEFVDTKWVPFKAEDIQLEFVMLDPYVRQNLQYSKKNDGSYYLDFKAPDVYGIFKFVIDYRRTGYSPLILTEQAVVRPLRLNEYERFITAAFPYYAGTFSMCAAFLAVGFFFLYVKE